MSRPSPQRNDADQPNRRPAPDEPGVDKPTPIPSQDDSDEDSWDSLGSTRVIEDAHSSDVPSSDSDATGATRTPNEIFDGRSIAAAKQPSTLGDYQLLRKIGEGAMGAVYLARQQAFDRQIALKVLFPHIAANPKLVERLYREGLVMGQLDHPNIVQAYGVGEDQGWHFIALEYIDGKSLQKWLAKHGRLTLGDAVLITLTVARALDYAHNQGLVHRDVKPDNVLITRTGIIKLADLGMVKTDDGDMALTQTGHAVGTPWYMPLEQAKNAKDTDRRSDIYALGCTLYCMLTGSPPFAGKTLLEVIQAKEAGTFPPARQANPEVPERLDLVIAKMAAKHPKYRYQNCTELVKDLESLNLANAALDLLAAKPPKLDEPTPVPGSKSGLSGKALGKAEDKALDSGDPNVWYVKIKDPEGRSSVNRMTTEQILNMLAEDALSPNAKASHHPRDGFRALPTYKEFTGAALQKASRKSVDQQSVRYRSLYKKIEEQATTEHDEKAKPAQEMPPWLPLALQVGGAALGIILLALFFWYVGTGLGR